MLQTPAADFLTSCIKYPKFPHKRRVMFKNVKQPSGAEVTCNSTFIPSTSRHESHESNVNMICSYLITEAATTFYISVTFINNNKSTPLLSGSLRVWRASLVSFITVIAVPLKLNMAPIYKYIYIFKHKDLLPAEKLSGFCFYLRRTSNLTHPCGAFRLLMLHCARWFTAYLETLPYLLENAADALHMAFHITPLHAHVG